VSINRRVRTGARLSIAVLSVCFVGLLLWGCQSEGAKTVAAAPHAQSALRFDCGTADSPVMAGYQRLTGSDLYTAAKGYGWEGAKPSDLVFGSLKGRDDRGIGWEQVYIDENRNALNQDAVTSEEELVFRADVPDGTYRVSLTLGDLSQAIGSMTVRMNGKVADERVAAWTPGVYRQMHNTPVGWWAYVRSTVKVKNGTVRISLTKDQSYYDQQMEEQSAWENPTGIHWRASWNKKEPPYYYIGYPFVHNSVMAIEILPYVAPPVVGDHDTLTLTKKIQCPALHDAISKYNSGDPAAAVKALEGVKEPEAQVAKAIVQVWLAGRMDLETEDTLVPAAIKVLRKHVAARPEDNGVAEVLQDAEIFQKALTIHLTRGQIGMVDGKAVQKNHFIENDKAIGWWWLINEGSPLYYKSQLRLAIAAHMLRPYIPALYTEGEIFKELENKFPNNRFVKYYRNFVWEPYGDGTHPTDWYVADYYSKTEGSPEWARLLQETYARMVDWSEWWIKFKQRPEGNIGGGWGDDVEIIGAFGYMGYIAKGVSDLSVQGTRNMVEGMWTLSEVDPDLGYCLPLADAEHTAEWTGNTLGMMVQIDHGNPLWIERSLKTAKLMRDLWTDYDDNRHRHFRANFFGASQIGGPDQANDSWINYRAIRPGAAVLAYNQNPEISQWFVEMGDAWLAAAMSTERGKPQGVIPAQVSFPEGILGGVDSPNWYTASHPPGTVNYNWAGTGGQSYKGYIQDLLMTAYRQTGDEKYLKPLRLEYELTDRYGYTPEVHGGVRLGKAPWLTVEIPTRGGQDLLLERWTPPKREQAEAAPAGRGSPAPAAKPAAEEPPAEEGSERWVASNLKLAEAWLVAKRMLEGRKEGLKNDITKQQIVDHLMFEKEMRKITWPLMTTQSSATDRVPINGLLPTIFTMTGGSFGGPLLRVPITYVNTTKYFAAAVMAADSQGFRILYHSMTPDAREIGIVPWELEPNGRYVLKYGPDADEDEVMDRVTEKREFVFPQAGTPIYITVDPKVTYVVELDQTERGRIAERAPDPALSAGDIRLGHRGGFLLARIHNVGGEAVRGVEVAFYDGNPDEGGTPLGTSVIPNIEAPNDLEPRSVTVGIGWSPTQEAHEIYVVVDPNDEIEDEITTFNNVAHRTLPEKDTGKPVLMKVTPSSSGGRGR